MVAQACVEQALYTDIPLILARVGLRRAPAVVGSGAVPDSVLFYSHTAAAKVRRGRRHASHETGAAERLVH